MDGNDPQWPTVSYIQGQIYLQFVSLHANLTIDLQKPQMLQ